jgi:transposase-like protein
MRKQKKELLKYSEAFKWQVVQEVLTGKLTKESARVAYGIKSNCAILYWMRKYSGNDDYRNAHSLTNDFSAMHNSKEAHELKERIKQLEEELRRANLRADLWQKMIEVAEAQLKIDIKKKYGAQPSKPSGGGGSHQE